MIAKSPMTDLQRRLVWLISIRLLIAVSITLPFYLYQPAVDVEPVPEAPAIVIETPQLGEPATLSPQERAIRILIAVISILTLLHIALTRVLRQQPVIQAYLQFTGDLLLVTLLIRELGDAANFFSILYVFVIVIAAVLLNRSGTLAVASLAYFLYAAILLFPGFLVPFFNQVYSLTGLEPLEQSTTAMNKETLIQNLAVHLIGFYGVAVLTSYLAGGAARAEEKLRAKHRDLAYLKVFHRDVLQSISSGLAVTDLDGLITSLNRAAEEQLGQTEQELVGEPILSTGLFSAQRWNEETRRARAGYRMRSELELERHGETAYIGFSLTLLRDEEGTHRGYILIFQNLTGRRKLEEQLRIKDRMAAIGEMAAGLAHEVGNPLAAITGSVQMLARRSDPSQRKLLEITLKESRRLDRTVKDFLRLAQPRERHAVIFDIAALLCEDIELLRMSDEVQPNHEIVAHIDPPAAQIVADQDQIGQIFWNLARNALQAMPEGGQLKISGHVLGERYLMRFRDTGTGMTDEERAKIFHPFKSFFDGGTGIGMAIVYRIVEEHHGSIDVRSEPGKGSVISVELPVGGEEKKMEVTV